jgi:aminoglycoside phosphotransferase (APT) family kinase protein
VTDPNSESTTARPRTSTRDRESLRPRLESWLAARTGGSEVRVSDLEVPQSNGMSSETLLFDAGWTGADGVRCIHRCVARLAPAADAMPIFPEYAMEEQFSVMRLVGERTPVPVPKTLWYEGDPEVLGTPFFVMERVDGQVPPDIMPYTFGDNWLAEASDEDRRRLQSSTIRVLASIHGLPATSEELAFLGDTALDGSAALRAHVDSWREYYEWAHGEQRIPVLEKGFAWLDEHWPQEVGPPVLSWGDSRIGNIVYADFEPAAVLDWEMACVGPRELDLGWLVFLHRFFQDIAEFFELPGLPGFLDFEEVAAEYASVSGHQPQNLRFHEVYAALRHGVVMGRVNQRRVRFGEQELPEDPDDLVNHKATLLAMLDGSYWPTGPEA